MKTCPICDKTNSWVIERSVGVSGIVYEGKQPTIACCTDCYEVAIVEQAKHLGDAVVSGSTTRRTLVVAALADAIG